MLINGLTFMRVLNEQNRELEVSEDDFKRLSGLGIKLIKINEPLKVVKTDNIIYTAINGNYPYKRKDIKCFGDDEIFLNPVMESKRYKILPHKFLENEIRIWIDGNIWIKESNDYIISRFLGDNDLAVFKHPYRENVWQEFKTLKTDKRFRIKWLQKQLEEQEEFYKKQGLPEDTKLWECNFIISRNTEKVNRLFEAWWSEICRWQWRDQVSFPYIMWKYGVDIKMNTIEEGNIRNHKLFKYLPH